MTSLATRRLTKELKELQAGGCPAGVAIILAEDLQTWRFSLQVYDSIYSGETFALQFKFSPQYPIDSPSVQFVVDHTYKAPTHPHIYTNGHICASILGNGWSPVLNVAAVCLTLQSMLASCKKKELPPDNDRYVSHAPSDPKKTRWHFHDDNV